MTTVVPGSVNVYDQDPKQVGETIQEALHQGLDGWTDEEKKVIEAFLADIGRAVKLSYE